MLEAQERERHERRAAEEAAMAAERAHRAMLEKARMEAEMEAIRIAEEEAAAAAAADAAYWAEAQAHEAMVRDAQMREQMDDAQLQQYLAGLAEIVPPPYPESAVRRDVARAMHQHLQARPTPAAAAAQNAASAHLARTPDMPAPSLMLTPRDRLESLTRFSAQKEYVHALGSVERGNLLEIEREAKALNDAALNAPPPAPLPAELAFGEAPKVRDAELARAQEEAILTKIYKGQPELYGRLYAGVYGAGRAISYGDANRFRTENQSTDLASQLDILRNTPMDPVRKIEILKEIREKNNIYTGMEGKMAQALATATTSEVKRGYGTAGNMIGNAGDSYNSVDRSGPPVKSAFTGNQSGKFIVS